jgi:hypothetical protein
LSACAAFLGGFFLSVDTVKCCVMMLLRFDLLEHQLAKTPEAKVKDSIKKILKENDVYYAMPIGTGFGSSGVPDFLCCVQGRFVGIEAKAGGNVPTDLQLKNMNSINAAGGVTIVIDEVNVKALSGYIKLIKENKV